MNVLVLNCGSSSVKYKMFDMKKNNIITSGIIERIGTDSSKMQHNVIGYKEYIIEEFIPDHQTAVKSLLEKLTHKDYGILNSIEEIDAVGHRVVHGGEFFQQPVIIDGDTIHTIERCNELAPLHNPSNIAGIKICRELMPDTLQAAIFDTAFHQTMPEYAYMYALPYEYYSKYSLRKYGFHGTSHKYVSNKAAEILDKDLNDLKIVSCHLGNGASLCAINNGTSQDTTMGFTPAAGLTMGTRSGDLDPGIISFLGSKENMDWTQISNLYNKESGVLGISGRSSDFRDLEKFASEGCERSQLALDVFVYDIVKGIGALCAAIGGLDVLVFTAGIGENSPMIRYQVCDRLKHMGVEIDENKNVQKGVECEISSTQSNIKVLLVPTNEELMIARETVELYENNFSCKSA